MTSRQKRVKMPEFSTTLSVWTSTTCKIKLSVLNCLNAFLATNQTFFTVDILRCWNTVLTIILFVWVCYKIKVHYINRSAASMPAFTDRISLPVGPIQCDLFKSVFAPVDKRSDRFLLCLRFFFDVWYCANELKSF